jgi:hypothetical protein
MQLDAAHGALPHLAAADAQEVVDLPAGSAAEARQTVSQAWAKQTQPVSAARTAPHAELPAQQGLAWLVPLMHEVGPAQESPTPEERQASVLAAVQLVPEPAWAVRSPPVPQAVRFPALRLEVGWHFRSRLLVPSPREQPVWWAPTERGSLPWPPGLEV